MNELLNHIEEIARRTPLTIRDLSFAEELLRQQFPDDQERVSVLKKLAGAASVGTVSLLQLVEAVK